MYGCESWTVKKAECRRIEAFELWCWRRLLRVPWSARRSNQSILKEVNPEYSLEELILKLKLQYFGYLMRRASSLEKTLMLGKSEGKRRRVLQRMRWLDSLLESMDMHLHKLQERFPFFLGNNHFLKLWRRFMFYIFFPQGNWLPNQYSLVVSKVLPSKSWVKGSATPLQWL